MDNRYEVFINGLPVCRADTYNAAYNIKYKAAEENPDADAGIFDHLIRAYINPAFHVMTEDGRIVYYADTEQNAERLAQAYTKKTGIEAFVLDNSKDYTGGVPRKAGA